MKINVEFDLTPQEFRQSMGLPDVEAFQRDLMSRIQQQMEAGVEGYDPMSLLQPFLQQPFFRDTLQQPFMKEGMAQGLANFGTYQQMMLDMLRQAGSPSRSDNTRGRDNDESSAKRNEEPADSQESGKSASRPRASASSRAKRS
ncbi:MULTISPECIES: hypothetical protein [Halomonadaceae]|uniref:hypothetical protein n=1 Tax=Halomonadaceae TaxID=28256 RepID=UPI00159A5BDB|nr:MULTISPECIES: hypothetical protein [Halomonas]QJQ95353.1 hypothetical protein HIO72_08755 [Halomonas sp. PA5]